MIHLFPLLTDDYPSSPDRVNAVEPNENACLPSASMSAGSQSQESANTGEGIGDSSGVKPGEERDKDFH